MWNHNAFLRFCHVMPGDMRWTALIDMDKIHQLNEEVGYSEVDKITIENTVNQLAEKVANQKGEAAG